MNKYLKLVPSEPTFKQVGLKGFRLELSNPNLEIYEVDIEKGHDNFIVSQKITHIYYVIDGSGSFCLNGKKFRVKIGNIIEVPPEVEYTYSGRMKLLLILTPPWFKGNEIITKPNPNVK